jgi:hypothetical protein
MLAAEGIARVRENHQSFRQESHWCTSGISCVERIPWAAASTIMQLPSVHHLTWACSLVRAFCNVPEMWKLHGGKSRMWCIMTEHLASKHGIQLVLELCGPCGDGRQDDDVSECSWSQLLKTLTVMVSTDYESRSRGSQCQIGQHHFTGGCLWFEFLWLGRNESSLHCLSAYFPMGTIVWHITCHILHIPLYMCITSHIILPHICQRYWYALLLKVCLSVNDVPTGNTLRDIQDTIWSLAYCQHWYTYCH